MVAATCITEEPHADGVIKIGYGTCQNKVFLAEAVGSIVT